MTETPFYQRLQAEAPEALNHLGQCAMGLTLAALGIEDLSTSFDYAVAVDNLLTKIGTPDDGMHTLARPDEYEASDVPLYLRLDKSPAHKPIKRFLLALNLNSLQIPKGDVRDEYNDIMQSFWDELGVPRLEAVQANPDAYPNVSTEFLDNVKSLVASAQPSPEKPAPLKVSDEQRQTEIAELEEIFSLETTEQG